LSGREKKEGKKGTERGRECIYREKRKERKKERDRGRKKGRERLGEVERTRERKGREKQK
jgi:hypothetical protein